jgi:hypothetical protein
VFNGSNDLSGRVQEDCVNGARRLNRANIQPMTCREDRVHDEQEDQGEYESGTCVLRITSASSDLREHG